MGLLRKISDWFKDADVRARYLSGTGEADPEMIRLMREVNALRGYDPSQAEFDSLIRDTLKRVPTPVVVEAYSRMKHKYGAFEPDVRKIIFSATGCDVESHVSRRVRHYIWNPENDPETAIEILKHYAELTDKVMAKLSQTKRLSLDRRLARLPRGEQVLEAQKKYLNGLRCSAWEMGPEHIEEGLKEILWSRLGGSVEERFSYDRVVARIFGDKKQKIKSTPSIKPVSGPMKTGNMQAAGPRDSERVIGNLIKHETALQAELGQAIAECLTAIGRLEGEWSVQKNEKEAAVAMYEAQRDGAKARLEEKERALEAIEKAGGNTDGYETPVEIQTLIANGGPRSRDEEIMRLPGGPPAEKGGSAVSAYVRTADIESLVAGSSDANLLTLRDEIFAKRALTSELLGREKKAEHRAFTLRRQIERSVLEIEKITSRTAALEAAEKTLAQDAEDLARESAAEKAQASSYPPLDGLKEWAGKNLGGRVRIHRDAFNEAARLSDTHLHPEWIYQGLELLAHEYWDQATSGGKTAEEAKNLRHEFARRAEQLHIKIGGSVTDLKGVRVREQYQASFDGERRFLDQHLRRGTSRNPNNILCVYFTWQPETRQVLIGHLPTHLDCSI